MDTTKLAALTLIGLFLKGVLLKWFSQKAVGGFNWFIEKYLIKYPREAAIWLHYQKKTKGLGHKLSNPVVCQEEDCRLI